MSAATLWNVQQDLELTMADVTDATFATDVVERSKTVPIVVDLWAAWCGPCQSLGPVLEKVIGETQGRVELAKVDVDANPVVAQEFQVQSIPAVYGIYDGKVVDHFLGARGEAEVVQFVQVLLDLAAADDGAEDGEAEDGDATDSDAADAPQDAVAGGAAAAVAPAAIKPDAVISEPGMPAPAPAAPSAAEADAIEAELKTLLTTVKGDDAARERYITLLEQLGAGDPRTNDYRRKLATALF